METTDRRDAALEAALTGVSDTLDGVMDAASSIQERFAPTNTGDELEALAIEIEQAHGHPDPEEAKPRKGVADILRLWAKHKRDPEYQARHGVS